MLTRLLFPCRRRHVTAALAFALHLLPFIAPEAQGQRRQALDASNCQLESGGESTVMAVAGPQTLHLADGRFVRLAEVLVPSASPGSGFDPSLAATAYLRSAALGRKVEVRFGGNRRDRYGVYIAHVYVAGDPPSWLQDGLLSAGLAQAFPQADNHACTRQLVSFEAKARLENRGHWGLALFKVQPARDTRAILNLVQTYQIVEGKVDHASEAGGRVFLHFHKEEKFGFTAVIESTAQKRFTEQNYEDWKGKTIRVRGWVERKKGPAITVAQPEQIELVYQPADSAPSR